MIQLIPAIDIIDGKCVRLQQGNYNRKKEYPDRPEEVAFRFQEMGIRRLHLVDLDGARRGHVVNLDVLERISTTTSLKIDFGGGIKSTDDLMKAFDAGAEMVTAGSIAVRDPEMVKGWLARYGSGRIILGTDVLDGRIAIQGWKERTSIELDDFIRDFLDAGIARIICTDIAVDGMLTGPSIALYNSLKSSFPVLKIIASGGVSGMQDILELENTGVEGVIFGKAFYEGKITEDEIRDYLKSV
jgi:phosphoribosylformimino-5-aminoimidazole carboxamide ribotide isomerase